MLGADLRLNVVAPGNYAPGARGSGIPGIIYHHIDGSIAAAEAVWRTPGLQRSAHFGVDLDGSIIQWLDTVHVAYASCSGNWQGYVSIECASDPNLDDGPPTAAQIRSIAQIGMWVGAPAVQAAAMGAAGVGYHRLFGGVCNTFWGQTDCPGDGFADAMGQILAVMSGTTPIPPEDDVQITYIGSQADPAQGIWAFDQLVARHIGGFEWGVIAFVNGGAPAVHALPPEMWDSIPKLRPESTLTLKDLAAIQAAVKAVIPAGGSGPGGGTTFTKLVGTIDLNARTLSLTPA
jgi:hypothetical protein